MTEKYGSLKTGYDIFKLFVVKHREGLGKHLECKLCGALFVTVKDASLHAITHVRRGEVKVEWFKEENTDIKPKKKEEPSKEERALGNALLTRWLK